MSLVAGYLTIFPQHNEFHWSDDAVDLFHGCETIGSLTASLQSSLFFGLLSAFLERDIDRGDFVDEGFINSDREPVHKYFRGWQMRLSSLSYPQKRRAQEKVQVLINFASLNSDKFEEGAGYFEDDENFDRVALSVKLLISLLSAVSDDTFSTIGPRSSEPWAPWVSHLASRIVPWNHSGLFWLRVKPETFSDHFAANREESASRYLRGQPNRFRPFPPGVGRGGRAAERLYRVFVDNGWCPYRALQLCRSYDYLVLNSLASLIRNSASVEDHGQCLEFQSCCAHNLIIDRPDEYPFQHDAEEIQHCEFVNVHREEITEIVQSGGIPLISMSLENDLDLQVVRCTPAMTYTAISHVWSDGLGNPQSNALPRYQLLRLRKMIFKTYFPEYSPFYDDSDI